MTGGTGPAWAAESVRWASGPWSLELRDGDLADIAYRGRRVLRAVRPVVRDRDWDVRPLGMTRLETGDDRRLEFAVRTTDDGPVLDGRLGVETDGRTLAATLDLTARAPVTTNRTGLVILHPADLSGTELEVTHPDGDVETGAFPVEVAPHQPVAGIRRLAWADGGNSVALAFEGDVFEMEDQRNWTDASFKTYNRPLALPFPFEIPAGEHVRQRIELTVDEGAGGGSGGGGVAAGAGEVPGGGQVPVDAATDAAPRVARVDRTPPGEGAATDGAGEVSCLGGPPADIRAGEDTATAGADAGAEARPGAATSSTATRADDVALIELIPGGAFPEIAVGAATGPGSAPAADLAWAASVLVELDLATANWRAALARACAAGRPLDVRLVLPSTGPDTLHTAGANDDTEATESTEANDEFGARDSTRPLDGTGPAGRAVALDDAVSELAGLELARVAVFHPSGPARHVSDHPAIRALREALERRQLRIPVVGGARSHFTELNREHHRLPDDLDGIVFALTPGFHERSTAQLVESVPVQRIVAEQAVRIAAGTPVFIGPVTLRPRFNDVATTAPPRPADDTLDGGYGPELIDADDSRQCAPELAAWTIASAAALSVPGVAGLTYFEEWGPRGIRTRDGAELPVAPALQRLAALAGTQRLTGESPDGLVWALGGRADGREQLLAANLDTRPRTVDVISPAGRARVEIPAGGWRALG